MSLCAFAAETGFSSAFTAPPAVPISSAGARKGLVSPCPGPHSGIALAPYGTLVVAAKELVLVAEE